MLVKDHIAKDWRNYNIFAFEVFSANVTPIVAVGLYIPSEVGRRTVELDNCDTVRTCS